MMQEEIGSVAGMIWHALNDSGELSLAKLKKQVNGKIPVFDGAIGWLAREDKVVITREKRSFHICLKGTQANARALLDRMCSSSIQRAFWAGR